MATVSAAVGTVANTVRVAADLLVLRPIYLVTSPFRRSSQDKEIRRIL